MIEVNLNVSSDKGSIIQSFDKINKSKPSLIKSHRHLTLNDDHKLSGQKLESMLISLKKNKLMKFNNMNEKNIINIPLEDKSIELSSPKAFITPSKNSPKTVLSKMKGLNNKDDALKSEISKKDIELIIDPKFSTNSKELNKTIKKE